MNAQLKGVVHVLRRKKPDLTKKSFFSLFEVLEVNQVLQFTHRYEVDNSSRKNRLKNMKMNKNKNKKYDEDPRCFWNDREARDTFPSFLVSVAIFFLHFIFLCKL